MARPFVSSITLIVAIVSGCQNQSGAEQSSTASMNQRCVAAGASVDSSFAVQQARQVLLQPGMALAPRLIQPVRDQGIELGLLISLAVTEPRNVVGGGGMAWGGFESGCAIVLRRYE